MLLNRAERLASERGWMRLVAAFLVERIRLLLREERMKDAQANVDQLRKIVEDRPAPEQCSWTDIHIGLAVAEGLFGDCSSPSRRCRSINKPCLRPTAGDRQPTLRLARRSRPFERAFPCR